MSSRRAITLVDLSDPANPPTTRNTRGVMQVNSELSPMEVVNVILRMQLEHTFGLHTRAQLAGVTSILSAICDITVKPLKGLDAGCE